jgi:hypothetical protein
MSISLENKVLLSSMLPQLVVAGLQTNKEGEKLGEGPMCAVALLIANTALGAIKALKEGDYKSLDANPGDGGCQSRALELRRLTMLDLKDECAALEMSARKILEDVSERKKCLKGKEPPQLFFRKHFEALTISKAMEYILHCYLSTCLRTPYHATAEGVVMTRSEVDKLLTLSARINKVFNGTLLRKIVEENQKILSMLSVDAMRFAAAQVNLLASEERRLMITMLSPENTHIFTPDIKYEPKAFGCLFYEVKTLLIRLREEQGIVCLKSIVASGKPFHLLLQSKVPGEELERVPDERYASFSPLTAVVVFEAVVKVEKERAGELLIEQGFTTTMLAQAAKESPYEPKSTLDAIKEPEAVKEMTDYKGRGEKMGDFITLDHVYLNTLGKELATG